MTDQQLIGKHMSAHGKDGIWKDMETTFMFKVLSSNISIGSEVQSYNSSMEERVHMLLNIGLKSIGYGIGDSEKKLCRDFLCIHIKKIMYFV